MKKILLLLTLSLFSFCGFAQNQAEDDDALYAVNLLKPGQVAPDFQFDDINGKPYSLKDFRKDYVVLIFWASWCPDCRAEIPDLRAMAAKYKGKNVRFVNISFDRTLEKLQTFAAENELVGVQLFDPSGKKESKVCADYGVQWIPSLFVIGPDGKILRSTVIAARIDETLSQIFAK